MKKIIRNSNHRSGKSHDMMLGGINNRKLKFVYEAYNAGEKCSVSIFDGNEWNYLFGLNDCGETPDASMYVVEEKKRLERANTLFSKLENLCKLMEL